MHGRLKVKTSAEQQEEKRKEREKKLKLYKAGTQKIFQKRSSGELDAELLTVTAQLLVPNPDVYTFWNVRKEVLVHLEITTTKDELQHIAQEELVLTEACMRTNPKSYGAWNHRVWVLRRMPEPDWSRDLRLCNRLLEMDERNFHGWDHRRRVCKHAHTSPADELDFTMQKIESNFSNYSAWHYRSSLLPLIYPSNDGIGSVAEDKLIQEYDLVQNAAFTDPADQSAWFYHRWLLGRGQKVLELDLLYVSREQGLVVVHSTQPIMVNSKRCSLVVLLDGTALPASWSCPTNQLASSVWFCNLSDTAPSCTHEVTVEVACGEICSSITCYLTDTKDEAWESTTAKKCCIFRSELSAATTSVLEQELESCNQLHELEPDNKWPLLTCVLLMWALNAQEHMDQINEHLSKLTKVDPSRRNYYSDLRSKCILENAIEKLPGSSRELSLVDCGLVALYHADHLVLLRRLDLSRNHLRSFPQVRFLLCLHELLLDHNAFEDCKDISDLPQLQSVSLRSNQLFSVQSIQSLSSCGNLRKLNLEGNAVCNLGRWAELVKEVLPNLSMLDGSPL